MVLVQLSLSNFMSYGTKAPVLDFSLFHVACLSGNNGQGKSALLDAITWALWGEARKVSGMQKPDENLIRIGTREMRVELVFDVEGDRFRVLRQYVRSATGRTSKPGLELHILDPVSGTYTPLTGSSIRETQQAITDIVGIDYSTFINSAFLLQGRSDEFTNKKPGERKEILSRILNLQRYEALSDLARKYQRDARVRLEQTEMVIDRLQEALGQESDIEDRRRQVQEEIEETNKTLSDIRARSVHLAQRSAQMAVLIRDSEDVTNRLQELEDRIDTYRADRNNLERNIEEAESVIARKEAVERDHTRFLVLNEERDRLDRQATLCREKEKQIEQQERLLQEKRTHYEKQLHRKEIELRTQKERREECVVRLGEEATIRRQMEAAKEAGRRLKKMTVIREKRKNAEDECARIETRLHGRREALKGEMKIVVERINELQTSLPGLQDLLRRREKLQKSSDDYGRKENNLEVNRREEQALAEAVREREGKRAILERELEARASEFELLKTSDAGTCPTCGTDLPEDKKERVVGELDRKVIDLQKQFSDIGEWIAETETRRASLQDASRALQRQLQVLAPASPMLAQVEEQISAARETESKLTAHREREEKLREALVSPVLDEDDQQRLQELRNDLKTLPFDEKVFEEIREEAIQVRFYEEQIAEIDATRVRIDELGKSIRRNERELEELVDRCDLDPEIVEIRDRIENLKKQLDDVGFDSTGYNRIKEELKTLRRAGAKMQELSNALTNRDEWRKQADSFSKRIETSTNEKRTLENKRETILEQLKERQVIEEEQTVISEQLKEAETGYLSLQNTLGEITARLERARQDREALEEYRKQQTVAIADQILYGHLKTAFGRNGIPSLLIESTLPELEDRANGLLERLTEGRMRVQLETLKDKKTGGTKETLEIVITDEFGLARPYETYSGGEAFRINFAIRIALAQLLAERNGVRIRTLVIDEGFGTQDSQGLHNLVEAIQTIQDDFEKIIVITHLEQLKSIFPVRIEVEKDPVDGSYFELIGA